eukprot:PhM_4_TR170/c0_g1_i1/m.14231/K14773/UTP23; U3 small nucleolar RNA-associated protein 23
MKTRVKNRKECSKNLRHYQLCHGLAPPFRVFLDSSALKTCVTLGIHAPRDGLIAMLGHDHVTPCTNDVILEHLREQVEHNPDDSVARSALKLGQGLLYVTVGKKAKLTDTSEAAIATQWAKVSRAATPPKSCLVATQHHEVRTAVRQMPDVPTVRIDHRTATFVLDAPTRTSDTQGKSGTRHVALRSQQVARDKMVMEKLRESGLASEPEQKVSRRHNDMAGPLEKFGLKKKAKGPNSLSCRKRVQQLTLDNVSNRLGKTKRQRGNAEEGKREEGTTGSEQPPAAPPTSTDGMPSAKQRKTRRGGKGKETSVPGNQ